MRRTIATLFALLATLVVAGPAAAGVATPVTVSSPVVAVHTSKYSGAGVYQWSVTSLPAGAAAEFTLGTKVGHCVNFVAPAGGGTATLRSGNDVDFGASGNTIPPGSGDPRVAQIKWLLLSSRARSTNGDLAVAHQLAIWRITNPANGPSTSEAAIYDDAANAASPSLATRLLSEAQAAGSTANNAAAITGGGGDATCIGTTRALTITGAPFTTANVTVSGGGTIAGATSLPVVLGSTGTAVLNVLGGSAGPVTVTASVKESTLVQVDVGPSDGIAQQDLATVELRDVTVSATITFSDCTVRPPVLPPPPVVKPTKPTPVKVARLTIVKGADHAKITSGGIVHYTITVRNADEDAAVNVRTCDQLPDGMTYVSIGSARLRRGNACFTKASLAPGASVTYKLVARVDVGAAGTFVNRATTVANNAPSRSATASVRATPVTRKPRNGVQGVVG